MLCVAELEVVVLLEVVRFIRETAYPDVVFTVLGDLENLLIASHLLDLRHVKLLLLRIFWFLGGKQFYFLADEDDLLLVMWTADGLSQAFWVVDRMVMGSQVE